VIGPVNASVYIYFSSQSFYSPIIRVSLFCTFLSNYSSNLQQALSPKCVMIASPELLKPVHVSVRAICAEAMYINQNQYWLLIFQQRHLNEMQFP